jgi:XRE family aerobic/anaerobic benzoate catabolism transcriptional regulator
LAEPTAKKLELPKIAVSQNDLGSEAAFLAAIGAEVRRNRAKRGMTRRQLAQASETSERYLAQIESGAGNPSVSVLRAIARALELPVAALLPEASAHPAALGSIIDLLTQIPETELPALGKEIAARVARSEHADRAQRIALVGLRGAGKSTLGRMLAQHLGWPFIELDRVVEEDYGASIPDLIEMAGTATFRRHERGALERVISRHDAAIITTAGGIVADPETYALLLRRTHTVWVKARPEDHMSRVMAQGDFRPMAQNRAAMADLVAILDARRADYARAEAELDTAGDAVDQSFARLLAIVSSLLSLDAPTPSPRTRGEGRGEGARPPGSDFKAQNRGEAPSPSLRSTPDQVRGRLSPRAAGRGEKKKP